MTRKNSIVPCAICATPADFFAEPMGPFCSSRCKLVDLGKWLNEEYCVSEPLRPEHFAEWDEARSAQEEEEQKGQDKDYE